VGGTVRRRVRSLSARRPPWSLSMFRQAGLVPRFGSGQRLTAPLAGLSERQNHFVAEPSNCGRLVLEWELQHLYPGDEV